MISENINDILDNDINKIINKRKNSKNILVLSGGAVKGLSQIGALHCLESHGLLKDIHTIAGTSAGSMVGLMYCIGYQPMELFKVLKLIDFKSTKKIETYNIINKYGFDDGSRMILVLEKLMNAKNYNKDITFKELYKKTNINLIVTGTCVNDKKVYYFSHNNYPKMRVLDAVRISISIPVLFTPVIYENKVFVDGGCMDNFPIHLFNDRLNNVIGIYVADHRDKHEEIKTISDYLNNTIQCFLEGMSQKDTNKYDKVIIKIKCLYNDDSTENIIKLFDDGYIEAQKRLNDFMNII